MNGPWYNKKAVVSARGLCAGAWVLRPVRGYLQVRLTGRFFGNCDKQFHFFILEFA